jgi:mRNA interferase MazF
MPNTTDSEFGDVLLVRFPFTDQTGEKRRPAVVVSSRLYLRERADLVLMPLTSQFRSGRLPQELPIAAWQVAGLVQPSVVKPIFFTLENSLLVRKLGRLAESDRAALGEWIRTLLGP